jgi:hypothetical protein
MLDGSNKLRLEREKQRKNRKKGTEKSNTKKTQKIKENREQRKGKWTTLRARTFEDKRLT